MHLQKCICHSKTVLPHEYNKSSLSMSVSVFYGFALFLQLSLVPCIVLIHPPHPALQFLVKNLVYKTERKEINIKA